VLLIPPQAVGINGDNMNIKKNVEIFINGEGKNKGRHPNERYSSFDYCFNYFQSFKDSNNVKQLNNIDNMQNSCLQLAFYLASWGMFRGSSFLLERSFKFFEKLINTIASFDEKIWYLDIDDYHDSECRKLIFECKQRIYDSLGEKNKASDILISKIMLGVFGNVPAYDTYFKKGFNLSSFNESSLLELYSLYSSNKSDIDEIDISTYDFITGLPSKRKYTIAKIIDMIGFIEGQKE